MRPEPVVLTREQVAAALTEFAARNAAGSAAESTEAPVAWGQRLSRAVFKIAGEQVEERLQDPDPEVLPAHDPRYRPRGFFERFF